MADALKALERFYAAEADYLAAGGPGKGDFSVMAAHLTPDVVMHQAPSLPYGGTWRGHDGMERFMAVMSELWSELTFREQHYAVDGERVTRPWPRMPGRPARGPAGRTGRRSPSSEPRGPSGP